MVSGKKPSLYDDPSPGSPRAGASSWSVGVEAKRRSFYKKPGSGDATGFLQSRGTDCRLTGLERHPAAPDLTRDEIGCSRASHRPSVPYGNCLCGTSLLTFVMNTEFRTERVHRTWFERLRMWRHAYETKVVDGHHEAVGRGPTPAAARDAALKRWNEQMEQWKEQNTS